MFLLPVLTLILAIYIAYKYHYRYQPRRYAKKLIDIGAQKRTCKKDPHDSLSYIKDEIEQNPDMRALINVLPGRVCLIFTSTDLIKQVLQNHHDFYNMNKDSELTKIWYKNGMVVTEGATWKLHRTVLSKAFQYDWFSDMIPTIVETAQEKLRIAAPAEQCISMPHDIELLTCDIVTRIFFGLKSSDVMTNGNCASEEVNELILKTREWDLSRVRFTVGMWPLNILPSYRRHKRRIKEFRRVFKEMITQRIQKGEAKGDTGVKGKRRDLFQILLEHRIENGYDPELTLTDDEILDEFLIFFEAGKDTTSILISMILYCCVKHPEWGAKLKAEVDKIVKDPKDINLDLINSMDFTSAFINEVLRMYPPAPYMFLRKANKDTKIGEFPVKKGTLINNCFMANHYNPKYFDNPKTFNPDRWLATDESAQKWKNDAFTFLPFSGGPRGCIGKHIALIEVKIIISLILNNYHINIDPSFTLNLGIVLAYGPKTQIPLQLTPIH